MTDTELRIPVIEEQAHLVRTAVPTDRIRVRTVVDTREQVLDDQVAREALSVERRVVERAVDAAPPPREEGDTTILSVVEERLVVTRQLFVVEEVLLHRTRTVEPVSIPVTLRSMRAEVEHGLPDTQSPQEEY